MNKTVGPEMFLQARAQRVLLDVRAPGEYAQGHIPGAHAFPLFSDEERAAVGTCYKQKGPEQALQLGLDFVGPKMAGFIRQAAELAPHRVVAVHCWRGGQRSQSMAWLLRTAGFDTITLEGGYKAYRQYVLQGFSNLKLKLQVISGKTGSGKTKTLSTLGNMGEQVIDLEALAHHKGSAFGSIGEQPQPKVEQFENDLFEQMLKLDPDRRVWIENESRSIGRVFIPDGFWNQMRVAPLYNIEIPQEDRILNLLEDYTHVDKAELAAAFHKIETKLGGQHYKAALEALDRDDFTTAAEIALRYYDKTYQHGLENNASSEIKMLKFDHFRVGEIAELLFSL